MAATGDVRNVIIIGSGPAGLTAAIYTARANLEPLVLEGEPSSTSDQPGGQLMLTTDVENFPGFPQGVLGPQLMLDFREQAARFGAELQTVKATKVDFSSRPYGVWVGDPDAPEPTYRGSTMIVSTGAQALMLGLPNEQRLLGYGVSTCATCDGFFFREQDIAVVGGGDSALEEAIFLTKFANSVTIIHRRDQLRASKIMQDRAMANPKIRFLWNSVVVDVEGDAKVEASAGSQRADRRDHRAAGDRLVRRDRTRAEHRPVQGAVDHGGQRLPRHRARRGRDLDQRRRRVRVRRRPGSRLPPGDHRGRVGLHGGDRRRALARGAALIRQECATARLRCIRRQSPHH